jgi:hypothetical protein
MKMYYENKLGENKVLGSISNECTRTPTLWMSVVVVYEYTFLDSFELWFWRKTGKINWTNRVKNEEVK